MRQVASSIPEGRPERDSKSSDMLDMLSKALSGRHQGERSSVAPSRASSTAGPFKINSLKMKDKDDPSDQSQQTQDQRPVQKLVMKASSYNARDTHNTGNLVLPKAISLPNDRGLPIGGRQGRFTLEEVKEEQPSMYQAPYPRPETTPTPAAPAATSPAPESSAPRRWSLLRMFAAQRKDATPPHLPNQAAATEQQQKPPVLPRDDAGQGSRMDLGIVRPSFNPRHAASMTRHGAQKSSGNDRRPSYTMCDTAGQPAHHSQGVGLAPFIPATYPGTASSAGTNWQTPQAELHTPSAYITPVPITAPRRVTAEKSRDMLQAAQQATPEQARAMLQKFSSIRAQQRRNSQVAGY
eukprot:jgi/Ulvmu1/12029/UM083_0042.1